MTHSLSLLHQINHIYNFPVYISMEYCFILFWILIYIIQSRHLEMIMTHFLRYKKFLAYKARNNNKFKKKYSRSLWKLFNSIKICSVQENWFVTFKLKLIFEILNLWNLKFLFIAFCSTSCLVQICLNIKNQCLTFWVEIQFLNFGFWYMFFFNSEFKIVSWHLCAL